jgi:hypothetical protein
MVIALLLAAAVAQPSAEAVQLGKELAEHGTLAALLPLMKAKEVEELLAAHPALDEISKARLRSTANRVFEADRDRVLTATGVAYARSMSIADMQSAIAFYRSPAGERLEAVLPKVIAGSAANMGKIDFKGEVLAAFCRDTGKLCAK